MRALLALLLVGCGASMLERARHTAHAYTEGELRLDCGESDLAMEQVTVGVDPVTGEGPRYSMLTTEQLAHMPAGSSVYSAYCPRVACCGRTEGQHEVVIVRCDDDACEVMADDLGACLTVYCATY